MIADILTVMWKERKGLFRHRGSRFRAVFTMMVPVIMVAVYFPWQTGRDWVDGPVALFALIVPMILVGMAVPEAFAGERERHTLGTLLASRLPDRAILWGKVALAVGYGWAATIAILLLSLITLNATHWDGEFLFYSPSTGLAVLVLSLLVATVVAGAGILISLRAGTVQEATQILMAILITPPMLLSLVFLLLHERIRGVLDSLEFTEAVLVAGAVLLVIGLMLLRAAAARFKRSRLILG